jgi:hypothetical protein
MDKNKIDIQNEFKNLGDLQAGISGKLGHVPFAYFDSFEQRLAERIQFEEAIQMLPKENPFEVPENYFAQVSSNEIIKQSKPQIKWLRSLSIAASVILLVGISVYIFLPAANIKPLALVQANIEDITPQEAQTYVQNNIDDYIADIAVVVENEKQTQIKSAEQQLQELNQEDIQDYLKTQDIEEIL